MSIQAEMSGADRAFKGKVYIDAVFGLYFILQKRSDVEWFSSVYRYRYRLKADRKSRLI